MAILPPGAQDSPGPLHDRLVGLAGMPDSAASVEIDLIVIAQLVASRVKAVDYASVTSRRGGAYATVATSSDVALAVDAAQYADDAGPCLEALDGGYPAAVPDIATTITWPGFRDAAVGMGLASSLSIPLVAGSGRTVAALNLYSHDPEAMAALTTSVWSAYDSDPPVNALDTIGEGGTELVAGLTAALEVRAVIQRGLGTIMGIDRCGADAAYRTLCTLAEASGDTLFAASARLLMDSEG